jgi:hypothetical protein
MLRRLATQREDLDAGRDGQRRPRARDAAARLERERKRDPKQSDLAEQKIP